MLSDGELRAELVRLGVNPGPITASTRPTYQRKLQKLLDASQAAGRAASNGYGQTGQPSSPSNGHGSAGELTDSELRKQLQQLGHNPGPITPATRGLYLKKLTKLQAGATATTTAADVNGYGRPAAAGGGGSRRRRPAPTREPEPEPEPEPMDESDAVDESDSVGMQLDDSPAAADSSSPVEYEFSASPTSRYDSLSSGYRPAGRSPMFGTDPPPPPASQPLFRPGRSSLFQDDPLPAPSPPARSALFRDVPAPAPAARSSVRDDPAPAPQSRYRPEPLIRARHLPEALYPRGTAARPGASLVSDRRPTPPPAGGRSAGSQVTGDRAAADPNPVTRAEPPPAESPGSLRQRVAAWCRPARPPPPPPAADYDTCSDSEPEEPAEPPPPALTPSQQLQAFRRRMAAGGGQGALNDRGFQPAAAPAQGASQLIPYCILLLAVLFFGVLGLSYLRLSRTDEAAAGGTEVEAAADDTAVAVFPICGDPVTRGDERGCISRENLEATVELLPAVRSALVAIARDALCGRRVLPDAPIDELVGVSGASREQIRDVAVLTAYNDEQRLGIRAEPHDMWDGNISLTAVGVNTPWLCLAGAALTFVIKWAFTLAAVLVTALVVRGLVLWRRRSRQQQQQQLYQMVESIMEVVRRHTLAAAAGAEKPYVAVDHVRDELLPPAERSSRERMALWQRAVQFIRDRESRVREECVLVAGESHTVWRWLPTTAAGGGRGRRRVWLGQAFQTSSGVNTPGHTRTNCLKIRHMFDPTCETPGGSWQQEVRDALLEKCDGIAILHIAVDARNTEGLVYVKCRTDADALSAFKRIQGCWFDGRLVSVKFIRQERYHERYAEAAAAAVPLRPSNSLRRSLADLASPAPAEDD